MCHRIRGLLAIWLAVGVLLTSCTSGLTGEEVDSRIEAALELQAAEQERQIDQQLAEAIQEIEKTLQEAASTPLPSPPTTHVFGECPVYKRAVLDSLDDLDWVQQGVDAFWAKAAAGEYPEPDLTWEDIEAGVGMERYLLYIGAASDQHQALASIVPPEIMIGEHWTLVEAARDLASAVVETLTAYSLRFRFSPMNAIGELAVDPPNDAEMQDILDREDRALDRFVDAHLSVLEKCPDP